LRFVRTKRHRSIGECERRADLVGEQNRHPELFDRRADDASRGCSKELTVKNIAMSDEDPDLLIRWQTVALVVHAVAAPSHVTIVVKAGILRSWPSAQNEPAFVNVQDLDDLIGNKVDQIVRGRLPKGNHLRGSEHPVEVSRSAAGAGLLATTPQSDFGDRDPDLGPEAG
jgi:hypothetical protein